MNIFLLCAVDYLLVGTLYFLVNLRPTAAYLHSQDELFFARFLCSPPPWARSFNRLVLILGWPCWEVCDVVDVACYLGLYLRERLIRRSRAAIPNRVGDLAISLILKLFAAG
jgi:hypothetical protein